ncbi:hypothetical protein GCU60_12400 [Blastococcus saxobsidens]|uniref:Uncharacterized protein n=1 Tax=Blastococcus saxobsidens TaxID=138336 RepID=A0A6L9W386_9ACTN|nr:hypothetical protein [Blastococcus saxobsidens]NEK86547.1 hypothetical protein [Blastococcus saxobsidens]
MADTRTATHAAAGRTRSSTRRRSPGSRGNARRRPARRGPAGRRSSGGIQGIARWWPALLVAAAVLAGVAWGTERAVPTGACTLPGSSVTLSEEQMANAATIAEVGWNRGLPDRAVVIALATAMQESTMRNLDYGDRDSLGLFQQRPSQGWGTPEQVQDPVYAAGQFYDRLVQVPDWETGELTLVADAVQRSAFPLAYGRWSTFAEELTGALHPAAGAEPPCA